LNDQIKVLGLFDWPTVEIPRRVLVVGGGVAGAIAARTLHDHGHKVVVLEKAGGPGGRCSTRHGPSTSFDHGAQYFTAGDPRIVNLVSCWEQDEIVARWEGRVVEITDGKLGRTAACKRWVGFPKMNRIVSQLLEGLDVHFGKHVDSLETDGKRWQVCSEAGSTCGPFDDVIVALPPPQTVDVLIGVAPRLAVQAKSVCMLPCWAVMLAFENKIELPFDGATLCNSGPIAWVARDSSKPGRPPIPPESWVIHANHKWSEQHIELKQDAVCKKLIAEFRSLCRLQGVHVPNIIHAVAHRWRYARPEKSLGVPCLYDADLSITICGDWLRGATIEDALLSGAAAAGQLLGGPAQVLK
jgi:predicted NAD/FAD-dependent oxidoreductase